MNTPAGRENQVRLTLWSCVHVGTMTAGLGDRVEPPFMPGCFDSD
ncbi:MAG: hypothetical protein QM299_08955 [Pseudomonadota bacterium]|nr:hypothetical protein [Pseudomonadota bacterium]HPX17455.1 hypothetical protein [Deltaproteobacteria bacterium]